MSFFDLQPRNINQLHPTTSIPPGYYQPITTTPHKNHAYAPFGSLSPKNKMKVGKKSVGPGDYNIEQPIIKPSISKYQNNNIIIVKINDEGGHQFKSKTNRFEKLVPTTQLGPGTYNTQVRKQMRAASFTSANNYSKKIRDINNKHFKERQPTLVSDPPQGSAEKPENNLTKAKSILNWNLSKQQRFDPLIKQAYSQLDKEKALSQITDQRNKKVRPSAIFSSKTIKSHLQTQIYKTKNPIKAQIRKMIQYKDDQPGPGSYQIQSQVFNQKQSKYQFFGSTVQRFANNLEENSVGPGHYKIQSLEQKTSRQRRYHSNENQDRYSYLPKNSITPGVGSYSIDKKIQAHSPGAINHSFGSHKARFIESSIIEQTPNQQNNFQNDDIANSKKQRKDLLLKYQRKKIINKPQAIFSSNSKRFKSQQPIVDSDYDLTQNDINTKVQKYRHLIKQLQECQLHKPPFLSSDQRFKAEKAAIANAHKDCWCLIKSVQKQMVEHKSPAFVSNQKRTAVFEIKQRSPPVGYYTRQKSMIIQQSFNSRFKKQSENAIKKTKLLDKKGRKQADNLQGNKDVIVSEK